MSDPANTRYEAIVIGASIGGLTAAAYLARGGARVIVLEARDVLGGAAETLDLGNGFHGPASGHTLYAFDQRIADELNLAGYGLSFVERDMRLVALKPGGRHLVLPRDFCLARAAVAAFTPKDARAYVRYRFEVHALARGLRWLWTPEFAHADTELRLSRANRERLDALSRMSAASYLDARFENDALKAALSVNVAMDGMSPHEPGSALLLAWRAAQEGAGRRGAVAQLRGGLGSLAAALAAAVRSAGGEIRTGARVAAIAVSQGRTAGVTLESGEALHAGAIFSSLDARRSLLALAPPSAVSLGAAARLPPARKIGPAKLLLALNGLPPFAGLQAPDLRGRLVIAERPESAAEAKGEALDGRLPHEPVMEVTIPTVADAGLAPAGSHVVSILVPDLPMVLEESWEQGRETLRRRVIQSLEAYAPGLKARIVGQLLFTPPELAARYGGEDAAAPPVPRLLASYAQRIRTVLPGLYLCGSAAEPVDAISGRAGRLAAWFAAADIAQARGQAL